MSFKKKRRRDRLFEKYKTCFWCSCKLVKPENCKHDEKTPSDMATLDHLRYKRNPKRQQPNLTGKPRTVIACFECNNNRASKAEKKLPKEELWERSGRYPKQNEHFHKDRIRILIRK